MCKLIKEIIVNVLNNHIPLLLLAARGRSKFEDWLKLELANELKGNFFEQVQLEPKLSNNQFSDIAFEKDGMTYFIELKTANTNWRLPGIENKTRPITLNISSIIEDAKKLKDNKQNGIVSFVLFPVPLDNDNWLVYLNRISEAIGVTLKNEEHCVHVKVALNDGNVCDFIVCCFEVI